MLKGFTRSSRTAGEYDDGIYIGFTGGRYGDIITHFQVYVYIYILLYYTIYTYILSYIIHIITIVMIYNCSPYSLLYSYNLFPQY